MRYEVMTSLFPSMADFPVFSYRELGLLTIDMQYLDAQPDGYLGRLAHARGVDLSSYFAAVAEIIPNISSLQQACRNQGVELIHVRIAAATKDSRESGLLQKSMGLLAPLESPEAQFLESVRPFNNELVINKTSASPFNSTAIDQILRNLNIRCLIATGVATNGCVELTMRDAVDRGYFVYLVGDACAALSTELHQDTLERLDHGLIKVVATEEILSLLVTE